ncbi:hypothetical protein KDW37_24080 [Burkholderia cenocepacia]|uniref:hypothetical protein n=1 Tax=Burkholderia cenocepacia TaxID=95486 RepID=UPI001B929D65|nr:hypothetical protein [Burkholderia cenocepacia]MBR8433838.1 hypothetical protein [Burkholderia cenocepacia]
MSKTTKSQTTDVSQFSNIPAVLAAASSAAKHLVPVSDDDHSAYAELQRAAGSLTAAHFALEQEGRADLAAECLKLRDQVIELEVSAAR